MFSTYFRGYFVALAVLLWSATACDTTDNNNTELDLIPVNSTSISGYTVMLEAPAELETGANYLYWKIEKDGELIRPQSFTITPVMDMGDMEHATPYHQPEPAPEDDQYLKNMVIFIMPSGDMGSWSISFTLTTQDGAELEGEMPITVKSSWKLTSTRTENGPAYFITWHTPAQPEVGNNKLKLLVHKRESMMHFPPVEDAEVSIYPYMDMGGGSGHSTDFTQPEATGNGWYEGDINYSMSGIWTTTVSLSFGNDTLPKVLFEYNVQAK